MKSLILRFIMLKQLTDQYLSWSNRAGVVERFRHTLLQHFQSLPDELFDAAKMTGRATSASLCNCAALSKPIVSTLLLLASSPTECVYVAAGRTNSQSMRTLPIGVQSPVFEFPNGSTYAGNIVVMPPLRCS